MIRKRDRLTTTIERQFLADIIARTKRIEYRRLNSYWTKRLKAVGRPFELRLINGMIPPMPEVTVLIRRVTVSRKEKEYRLHIKKVLEFKHWDKKRGVPKR